MRHHQYKIEFLRCQERLVNGTTQGIKDYLFRVANNERVPPIADRHYLRKRDATERKLTGAHRLARG